MRIGVDASLLSLQLSGIGRYVLCMTEALRQRGAELYLYSWDSSGAASTCAVAVGQQARSGPFDRIARAIFLQTIAPYRAWRDAIDVFWGAAHRLPLFMPSSIARVVTVHDLVWKHAPHTMKPLAGVADRLLMGQAVRQADRILAVSESTRSDLSAEFPALASRLRVVHPAATKLPDSDGFEALLSRGIDRPYVLFVGTLEPRKNLLRLLEAYARLPEHLRLKYPLVIAGGKGWGGVDASDLSQSLDLEGSVHFTGFVSDAELSTLYAHARMLAMPSVYEGFGLPLVEAMSYGLPVLTSNISSLPEVAGDAGVYVDPMDVRSIEVGLARLLADDNLHAQLSRRATARGALFYWDKAAEEALAIFREAVDERRQR